MTKVLVIEDNDKNRYLISFILKGAGYEVIEAITGEEGIGMAEADTRIWSLWTSSYQVLTGMKPHGVSGHLLLVGRSR